MCTYFQAADTASVLRIVGPPFGWYTSGSGRFRLSRLMHSYSKDLGFVNGSAAFPTFFCGGVGSELEGSKAVALPGRYPTQTQGLHVAA